MLWFGSIIAHFVAIQKPWQRKCRSSSVHREKAHGNRKVKARKRKTPHHFWCGVFCPLAGISWNRAATPLAARTMAGFRPLAGISWNKEISGKAKAKLGFPSPCGGKLKFVVLQFLRKNLRFPSPCGDKLKCRCKVLGINELGFPSPCGDKLKFVHPNGFMATFEFSSPCGDKLKSGWESWW